ncbi:GtrA family protein [Crenobacter sp. SG2303]|uniref:GtrA family protein n=1 Tax=Crenobacter oryzisoli TaxID=3056844 RepID=A0ABT7XSR2_9NEIS|nr:GtrA family protein [Crenobacter sp. SG2303]MDN0076836.1 GtrA family protein [Crenobacter sp. SG2303]
MIKRELAIFLVVGATTVLVDFVTYRGLIRLDVMAVDMAKAIGFLVGTLFAYFANRFWTFGHKSHAPGNACRFVVLYASTLAANVLINSLALKVVANTFAAIQLPFLLATGVSASLNFLGMKLFVFRQRNTSGYL